MSTDQLALELAPLVIPDPAPSRRERWEAFAAANPHVDLPGEEWRPISGWESSYAVSNMGRVKSLARPRVPKDRLLNTSKANSSNGYVKVAFGPQGAQTGLMVHRLVALAFLGEPPTPQHEVCHYDGDKLNNRVSNLRWGTRSENAYDSVRQGVHPMASKTHCKRRHPFTPENTHRTAQGERRCRTCLDRHRTSHDGRERPRSRRPAV